MVSGSRKPRGVAPPRWIRPLHSWWKPLGWIWGAIFLGGFVNVSSSWLTTKNFDLSGTPLGWGIDHLWITLPPLLLLVLLTGLSGLAQRSKTVEASSAKRISILSQQAGPIAVNPPSSPLSRVWNIPYPRNPVFTGREEILKQIHTQLQTGQATALSQAQAISGLGGIGKTQVAVEFAYQHQNEYPVVLWAGASTRESLISSSIAIAKVLGLEHRREQDQTVIIETVKRWLQDHHSWLLILDNADDLATVGEFIPPTFGGHILLTTRAQSTGRLAKRIEVDAMDEDIGTLFLLRRVGLIEEYASLEMASANDVQAAREICKELGGLPLALDQAGAYIEEAQCSLQDYQKRYRTRRTQLLRRRGGLVPDHPEPVAATWSLSFEKIEQRSPLAADLLRLCAFLHPDAIPVELITKSASYLGALLAKVSEDDLALDEAVVMLSASSLIRRNIKGQTLSIHRLVQAVLRDTMDEPTWKRWAERAVQAVDEIFPEGEFSVWPQCERYLPHALVCAELVEQGKVGSPEAAHLLNETGWYLYRRARYMEAERLYRKALTIREQQFGVEHPDTASSLDNLADLCETQGKYTEARSLFERALAIKERQLEPDHLQTARSLNGLAFVYWRQGKYTEAEPLYKRALAIREQQLGPEHPWTAMTLDNLAKLYQSQGRDAEAEPLYKRALAIREQQLGPEHPDTALSLGNLALLYRRQDRYAEAEPLLKRAVEINEEHLGSEHPWTAHALRGLAFLYENQSKYGEAEPLFRQSLTIYKQILGEMNPWTQNTREWYVQLLRKMGHDDEATALETRGQLPSEEH